MGLENPEAEETDTSIADDLGAAFDAAEKVAAPANPEPPVTSEAAPAEAADVAPVEGDRDEKGRFKTKVGEVKAEGEQPPIEAALQPAAEKAPASWRPAVREHWAKLPPEVQVEVTKRERETAVALQESAGARRLAEQVQQVTAPYMPFLRAEGVEPLQAINSLLSHAQVLRQGTPEVKGKAIAQWIQQFGVPLEAINAALPGAQPGASPTSPPTIDPRAIAQQVRQDLLQERQVFEQQRQAQVVQDFVASPQHEFIGEVREDMADLLDGAARRGVALSLDEAYSRACRAHPEVSKIMQQREAARASETARAATQRTRAASSSIRSQPVAAGPRREAGDDRRSDLEDAFAEHGA